MPPIICDFLNNIIHNTHDGSHRGKVDAHVKDLKTPYLFKSLLYQLLDVLVWFKEYIDQKPPTKNWDFHGFCGEIGQVEGTVIERNQRGYAFLRLKKAYEFLSQSHNTNNHFIPTAEVTKHQLINGQKITAIIEEYMEKGEQKTRVKNVEKL